MNRRDVVKEILWVLATVGLVAAFMRFARGLGATTALNDATPWGFWVGLKLAFVALSGGGFVIAGVVYVFHLERYRPVLRRAVLSAFLGYGSFIVLLLCDLGLPWRIWFPMVHWQHHSVLFEVAWCVMLYFSVLLLEFSPAILEHPWFQRPLFQRLAHLLKKATVPLVIAGIVLSTLHQSSLGSLFLIMPFRLHPLWYSPIIPILFFVSAIGLGLMAVIMEGFISAYLYGHRLRMELLPKLGGAASIVLWLYLVLRVGDLAVRGVLPGALDGSWQSLLFALKIGGGVLLPALLLSFPSLRNNRRILGTSAVLTALGIGLNRLSVGMIAMRLLPGTTYFPSWGELALGLGIAAGAGLVFLFFTERLGVFEAKTEWAQPSPYTRPEFLPGTLVYKDGGVYGTVVRRSLVFILVAALGAALLPARSVTGQQVPITPVTRARGWNVLRIDGNRAREKAFFDHPDHTQRLGRKTPLTYAFLAPSSEQREACLRCHHLNHPEDGATPCWLCHQDMYRSTSIFDHDLHEDALGGNQSCGECHAEGHADDTVQKPCQECHEEMVPGPEEETFNPLAPSYKEAMHGLCLECHRQESQRLQRPQLELCVTCHPTGDEES